MFANMTVCGRKRILKRRKPGEKRKKSIVIVLSVAAVCIALVFLLPEVISAGKYRAAKALYEAGQYEDAIAAFEAIGTYRDSAAQIEACRTAIAERDRSAAAVLYENGDYEAAYALLNGLNDQDSVETAMECLYRIQKDRIGGVTVGETIRFGSYEQDNDLSNGPEEIEWLVLDVDGSQALVISKYGLNIREFNDEKDPYAVITWGNCQLRTWLNGQFLNTSFGSDHRKMILTSEVPAGTNPDAKVSPGRDTKDKVFILSIEEAYRYFDSDRARQCFATAYCSALGAEKGDDGGCYWWLRSPGIETSTVTVVLWNGAVFTNGFSCGHVPNLAIRPVMRIDLGAED